jgi:hypothetical protein
VQRGYKQAFLEDLSWLSNIAPVTFAFRNTADGFKLLFQDDVFCEFAVFEPDELSGIPFSEGRVVWKADGVSDDIARPARVSKPTVNSLEFNLGEALTNLYVGLKRFARGEKLIAARFVQQYAVDRLLELNEHLERPARGFPDPFNRERRLETRYPLLALQLSSFVQGYEATPASASAVLTWLETHFEVNRGIARAIRDEIEDISSTR